MRAPRSGASSVNRESIMASLDIPFEHQLLAFKACLAR
jgi:hypothetical protein